MTYVDLLALLVKMSDFLLAVCQKAEATSVL